MTHRIWLGSMICLLSIALSASAQPAIQPIVAIKVTPDENAFKDSTAKKPILVTSADDAAKLFSKDALETIKKQVDFTKQIVLVFAWRGSGGDKLSYSVAESFPEQIFFKLEPGRTRDLRPHSHVYALRSNVRWGTR